MALTSYLHPVFGRDMLRKTADRTYKAAKKLCKQYPFDTIAFCGISGSAMAFILAYQMKLELLAVRKPTENSHYLREMGGTLLEGNTDTERYLIVDDFMCSGDTINFMLKTIHENRPTSQCVALLMYNAMRIGSHKHPITEQSIPFIGTKTGDFL